MAQAKKSWGDMSQTEKQTVFDKLKAVYDAEPLAAKINVEFSGEYVHNLNAGNTQNQTGCSVSGQIGSENADKVDGLKAKFQEALSTVQGAGIDIGACYGIGDQVTPISDVTVVLDEQKDGGSDTTTFSPEPGTVYLIDFWATWCPPCQAPMAHNQKMIEENKDKWAGKVQICGFSIDGDANTVKNHVTQKGWTAVNQYWVRNGTCKADKQFSFRGVPFCVLLDTEGKVAFMGHPASRTFEDDFQTLLDGKKLTGQGTGPSDEEDDGGSGSADVDGAGAVSEFQKEVESIKTKLDADLVKKLMRAFLVLVETSKFDAKSGTCKTSLEHYQVMMGPQDAVTHLKTLGTELRADSKPWKVNLREQVM